MTEAEQEMLLFLRRQVADWDGQLRLAGTTITIQTRGVDTTEMWAEGIRAKVTAARILIHRHDPEGLTRPN
jgi:hypothetical protein